MIEIVSHRGLWRTDAEKNSKSAFDRSFSLQFGTETDLRDLDGEVVISHDPAKTGEIITLRDFCSWYQASSSNLPLALNIKADGLQSNIKTILDEFSVENYRLFDMSVPDLLQTKKFGLPYLTRVSDLEPEPILFLSSQGLWVDAFEDEEIQREHIEKYIDVATELWIVSSELHGRNPKGLWAKIKELPSDQRARVFLCTDYAEQARRFFSG